MVFINQARVVSFQIILVIRVIRVWVFFFWIGEVGHLGERQRLNCHRHLAFAFCLVIAPSADQISSLHPRWNIICRHLKSCSNLIPFGHNDQLIILLFEQGRDFPVSGIISEIFTVSFLCNIIIRNCFSPLIRMVKIIAFQIRRFKRKRLDRIKRIVRTDIHGNLIKPRFIKIFYAELGVFGQENIGNIKNLPFFKSHRFGKSGFAGRHRLPIALLVLHLKNFRRTEQFFPVNAFFRIGKGRGTDHNQFFLLIRRKVAKIKFHGFVGIVFRIRIKQQAIVILF